MATLGIRIRLVVKIVKNVISKLFLNDIRLGTILAWQDVANSYKRSRIGPFWTTINTSVLILCLGLVFSSISQDFSSGYFGYIAFGVVFWGFISATLGAAGTIFAMNEGAIRHTNLFFRVYYLRHMLRSTLTLAHNLLIFPFVSILFGLPLTVYGLLVIPGLLIVGSFLWATSVSLAYISTRFRDFSPMIVSFMTILFYLTPVVWLPDQLHSNWRLILVDYNPLAQLLEILRAPLLGLLPSWHSVWYSLASTAIVGLLAILLGKKYSSRVAYWL